ncbi:MAG TPA: sensor histidine kinase [Anaerolineales bacterium]|nr:sensor histidine kinase [Anaerolineales bacterium]
MLAFTHLNFARQFLLISFFILLAGMLIIGAWVGEQIEIGVANRTAAVTALYVDSFIAPHLQDLARSDQLDAEHLASLGSLLDGTPLGQRIVAFKVWGGDGRILYSTNPALIGRKFPVSSPLAAAFAGEVHTEISDLVEPENEYEQNRWPRLIETYAPVRVAGASNIVAVSEFYQTTDELDREVRAAQWRSWLVVGVATLAMYLLLAGLVGRASNTIVAQQEELRDKVAQLTALLAQNGQLHERVRRAAARTTALNERFLRRLSADLHDGPGQDLSLALLRIEAVADVCAECAVAVVKGRTVGDDFRTIQTSLESALKDLRAISAGLRLPEIGRLSLAETAERAVRDYERKTGQTVALAARGLPIEAALPVKIILYRLLQESLANGFRHAGGVDQRVEINSADGQLLIAIRDSGRGFDPKAVNADGHLGLAGMRERVELLGGTFEVISAPDKGTAISAHLPLAAPEVGNE